MILVTALAIGFMALIQDAELLALYALQAAFGTPLLLSALGRKPRSHALQLSAYSRHRRQLVLAALKPWSRLLFGAFVSTVVFVIGWWISFYADSAFGITAFFIGCFFLMFAFAPHLVRAKADNGATLSAWDALAGVLMPLANAAFGFIAFYALFDGAGMLGWADPWLAVMFAAFYLALLQIPATGKLDHRPADQFSPACISPSLSCSITLAAFPSKPKDTGLRS